MANDIEIFLEYIRKTEKAILMSDGDNEEWLPLSQISIEYDLDEIEEHDEVLVILPEWLANDKGFI